MPNFLALYRGRTVHEASIIGVSIDAALVAHVAATLLSESAAHGDSDAVVNAVEAGRREALRLVLSETDSSLTQHKEPKP